MWRSGPISSEWVDLRGTVKKGRGSSLVPKRKESPTDQGRAFLGIFMMRMRRHHEFMCVSLTCTDHLFSKHWWAQSRDVLLSLRVCDVVSSDSVASPQSNMGFCVLSAVFLLYRRSNRWRDIKKLKHTAFLPHSQKLAQKDFLKLALRRALFQKCWTSSPFSFTRVSPR